jgi:hypothetical protein
LALLDSFAVLTLPLASSRPVIVPGARSLPVIILAAVARPPERTKATAAAAATARAIPRFPRICCSFVTPLPMERPQPENRKAACASVSIRSQTGVNMLPLQWLQITIAVLDIRTIVECSPQLGQTETSS